MLAICAQGLCFCSAARPHPATPIGSGSTPKGLALGRGDSNPGRRAQLASGLGWAAADFSFSARLPDFCSLPFFLPKLLCRGVQVPLASASA